MTAVEKANELYSKYDDLLNKDFGNPIVFDNQIKQCALIAVDEILDDDVYDMSEELFEKRIEYWQEVKQEIEKL